VPRKETVNTEKKIKTGIKVTPNLRSEKKGRLYNWVGNGGEREGTRGN